MSKIDKESEIEDLLARHGTLTRPWPREIARGSDVSFDTLIRDEDPSGMKVAEDLLLERGWKMRGVTGAMHARNFTIAMNPTWWPAGKWKMVQANIAEDKPGKTWLKVSVANGPVRVARERTFSGEVTDEARMIAVANAWAIAKEIKSLPLSAPRSQIEEIVDRHFRRKTQNLKPRELF